MRRAPKCDGAVLFKTGHSSSLSFAHFNHYRQLASTPMSKRRPSVISVLRSRVVIEMHAYFC